MATMIAGLSGGASVRRIRTPTPQDVLSGRGGGINSHEGNKVFREWVHQRKEDYNLAQNKKEKIEVAMQVVRRVQQQLPVGGRFLQKDPTVVGGNGGHWWVEIDETKALAKTTQALREGAPKIREAHQTHEVADVVDVGTSSKTVGKTTKKRKRKVHVPVTATSTTTTTATETETSTAAQAVSEVDVDDATEKLVLKQDVSSLPRYKSEQLLLPTTDYTVALERLQENVEKAKHEADRQQEKEKQQEQQPQAQSPPMSALVAPLTSNKLFNERYRNSYNSKSINNINSISSSEQSSMKQSRFNPLTMSAVDPFADTPPLMAAPEPDLADEIPVLSLDGRSSVNGNGNGKLDGTIVPPRRSKLPRVHSLALSDYDVTNASAPDDIEEFVNPFADESNVLVSENDPSVVMSHVPSSVSHQWGNGVTNGTGKAHALGITGGDNNCTTNGTRFNSRSINGCLNRLLSFSDSSSTSSDYNDEGPRFRIQNEENICNNTIYNNDYFFHDDLPEGDFGEGMKSILDVVHPDLTSPEKGDDSDSMIPALLMPWRGGAETGDISSIIKNKSTSSLIRRTSFSSRNRVLASGRQ